MVKAQEKHRFTVLDTVTVFGLCLAVGLIVFSIVTNAMSSQTTTKARIETQRLALQLLGESHKFKEIIFVAKSSGDRLPASENSASKAPAAPSRIGTDPWGEPYYYRTFYDQKGMKIAIVYSAGPNGQLETSDKNFQVDSQGHYQLVRFGGDDIGAVQKSWQ
jgi:hypothetical protein